MIYVYNKNSEQILTADGAVIAEARLEVGEAVVALMNAAYNRGRRDAITQADTGSYCA